MTSFVTNIYWFDQPIPNYQPIPNFVWDGLIY